MKKFVEQILPRLVLTLGALAITLLFVLSNIMGKEVSTRVVLAAVFMYVAASWPISLLLLGNMEKNSQGEGVNE